MDINQIRKLAGLPVAPAALTEETLTEKKKKEDAPAPEAAEELPAIVTKVAKKAEGKSGDELVALINKVYEAGCKDGKAEAKAEMDGGEKKKDAEMPVEEATAAK